MWTRVLSWDRKWLYLVTHFVQKDAARLKSYALYPFQKDKASNLKLDRKDDAIFASALSKCVFKKGRLTIPPEVMLQASGLLPPKPADTAVLQTEPPSTTLTPGLTSDTPIQVVEKLDAILEAAENRLFHEAAGLEEKLVEGPQKQSAEQYTWEKVEDERRRGMEIAKLLAGLDRLEQEFTVDTEALGRHGDL
ncbi:hypothetical protein MMC12_001234 [Toensbergia leucococca]|nr:hypothetical protein [Toensbergia leucococca]